MRKMVFVIFYTIVLSIYLAVNYYIYMRGMQALPDGSMMKSIMPYLFWGLAATYVAGRFLERFYLSIASDILVWAGSFWLAAMLYFFLALVLIDLLRLINNFIPFFPAFISSNYEKFKLMLFSGLAITVLFTIIAGHINTLYPVVRTMDVHIAKQANGMKELNVVMMSDIHLGTLIGNGHFEKIVQKVQGLEPDIIFLAGDVLDEDLEPVLRQNIGQTLQKLSAPLGVYAVMGNHEYIGGAEPAYNYLKKHGLKIIRDSVIKIEDSFYIIGREDRDKPRFAGRERLPLDELVAMADADYPLILLDHQPYYLEEAAALGVDLQFSGHTHHGQMWPLNYITSAIYTISRGYGKIDNMHVYVSNGVGTWGPPVRVGNRPEIIQMRVRFGED
ncbi:MAG: metallophosphoesterase [Bacteroidetes bacterium]|nr:MAG: metallophosphoesterase [Bacteroidota bacterium]